MEHLRKRIEFCQDAARSPPRVPTPLHAALPNSSQAINYLGSRERAANNCWPSALLVVTHLSAKVQEILRKQTEIFPRVPNLLAGKTATIAIDK